MKVTIDVDCTPEEARAFLGLPAVAPLQEAMMQELQKRMLDGFVMILAPSGSGAKSPTEAGFDFSLLVPDSLFTKVPETPSDPDPRALAALERACLLAAENRVAEALAVLEAAPSPPPVPWRYHDLRAGLLLAVGRTDEALESFELSMRQDHIHPSFAALLPRNLAMLEATLATSPQVPPVSEKNVRHLNSLCQ